MDRKENWFLHHQAYMMTVSSARGEVKICCYFLGFKVACTTLRHWKKSVFKENEKLSCFATFHTVCLQLYRKETYKTIIPPEIFSVRQYMRQGGVLKD